MARRFAATGRQRGAAQDAQGSHAHRPTTDLPNSIVAYRIANGGEVKPGWQSALSEQAIWDLVNFIRAQRGEAAE